VSRDRRLEALVEAFGKAARGGAPDPETARQKLGDLVTALREAGVPPETVAAAEDLPRQIADVLTSSDTVGLLDAASARLDALLAGIDAERDTPEG
jgi:hypothetical protein